MIRGAVATWGKFALRYPKRRNAPSRKLRSGRAGRVRLSQSSGSGRGVLLVGMRLLGAPEAPLDGSDRSIDSNRLSLTIAVPIETKVDAFAL